MQIDKKLELACHQIMEPQLRSIIHELKGTLAVIRGNSYLLGKIDKANLSTQGLDILNDINDKIHKMALTLDSLYEYAVLGSDDDFNPLEINLKDIVTEGWESIDLDRSELNFQNNVSDIIIQTNKALLLEVIVELLSNSIQFKQPGIISIISVSSKIYQQKIILTVTDNGRGMSEREQNDAFLAFKHAQDSKGFGIGLARAQKIAYLLNSDLIILNSSVGKGTTMSLTLPKTFKKA
jgi:signal transduction histidine kinase